MNHNPPTRCAGGKNPSGEGFVNGPLAEYNRSHVRSVKNRPIITGWIDWHFENFF